MKFYIDFGSILFLWKFLKLVCIFRFYVCIVNLVWLVLFILVCSSMKCCSANIVRMKSECNCNKALTFSHGWKLQHCFQHSLLAAPKSSLAVAVAGIYIHACSNMNAIEVPITIVDHQGLTGPPNWVLEIACLNCSSWNSSISMLCGLTSTIVG